MKILCHQDFKEPEYYFNNDPARVYICDLNHKAPSFIKKVKELGYIVYGSVGRRPSKGRWIAVCSTGAKSPKTYWIKLSNGTIMLDYSSFDTQKGSVSQNEMERIITQVHKFEPDLSWTTSNKLIELKLPAFLEAQCKLTPYEDSYYSYLDVALRGGANCVLKLRENIQVETHVDYHQIYGYAMSREDFPCGKPVEVDGYYEHPFAIYMIEPGTMARLKEDGYPIMPIGQDYTGMAGVDGEWFDVGTTLKFICDVDLKTMLNNYEFKDNYIGVVATLYYPNSFSGKEWFKPIVDEIYTKRKAFKGQPEERFFKILNEVLPGHFERRNYFGGFWLKNFVPNKDIYKENRFNPKVGIFITAYARKYLDNLLHKFPKKRVIGFDTDCVFFAGTKNAIPYAVQEMFGDEPGQVHEDGCYRNVYHRASKSYYGFDTETGESFDKRAGFSKSGYAWKWYQQEEEYRLEEVSQDEEERQFTL